MVRADRIARGPVLWADVLEVAHDKGLFGDVEIEDEWYRDKGEVLALSNEVRGICASRWVCFVSTPCSDPHVFYIHSGPARGASLL